MLALRKCERADCGGGRNLVDFVSHVDGNSVFGRTCLATGRSSDDINFLPAFVDGEVGTEVGSGIDADADLVAALVAAFPDWSREQLIMPLGVNVEVAVGKVGLRGVVGVGQVVLAVPKRQLEVGAIADKPVNGDVKKFGQLRILDCKDDGEVVHRRVCLVAAREDHVDFDHAGSVDHGPEADQRAQGRPTSPLVAIKHERRDA